MCDCKQKIEARLQARYAEQHPQAKNHTVRLNGYALVIDGDHLVERPCMPIAASADHTAKTGRIRNVKHNHSMFFNYCPFCGEKLAARTKEGDA